MTWKASFDSGGVTPRRGFKNVNRGPRTYCKLGKHSIPDGEPSVWLTSPHPLGLSCLPCTGRVAPEIAERERARIAVEAARARRMKRARQ